MNIIETLPKTIEINNISYGIELHITAWNRLCICYRELIPKNPGDVCNMYCSVCVEPENVPTRIEETVNCAMNSYVGNARTLDEAAQMLKEYVETYILN